MPSQFAALQRALLWTSCASAANGHLSRCQVGSFRYLRNKTFARDKSCCEAQVPFPADPRKATAVGCTGNVSTGGNAKTNTYKPGSVVQCSTNTLNCTSSGHTDVRALQSPPDKLPDHRTMARAHALMVLSMLCLAYSCATVYGRELSTPSEGTLATTLHCLRYLCQLGMPAGHASWCLDIMLMCILAQWAGADSAYFVMQA